MQKRELQCRKIVALTRDSTLNILKSDGKVNTDINKYRVDRMICYVKHKGIELVVRGFHWGNEKTLSGQPRDF